MNETIKGIDKKRNTLVNMEQRGDITLKLISPKPNRKYRIFLTKQGIQRRKKLDYFIKNTYPKYKIEINEYYNTLKKFHLM